MKTLEKKDSEKNGTPVKEEMERRNGVSRKMKKWGQEKWGQA